MPVESVCQPSLHIQSKYLYIDNLYQCIKNPSKESVCQSRVYFNVDYIFRVFECINGND